MKKPTLSKVRRIARTSSTSMKETRVRLTAGQKYCNCCQNWRNHSDYQRNATRGDGLRIECKFCSRSQGRLARLRVNDA